MNKRQAKKWRKKTTLFSSLEWVVNKCSFCEYYEAEDKSVGLREGCFGDYLYDENDNILEEKVKDCVEYMNAKGYICPYFVKNKNICKGIRREQKLNLPKSYKEYKNSLKVIEKYYKNYF